MTPNQGETREGGDTAGDVLCDPGTGTGQGWATEERDGANGHDVGGVLLEVEPAPEGVERGAALHPAHAIEVTS